MSLNDARLDGGTAPGPVPNSLHATFPEKKRILDQCRQEAAQVCKEQIKAFVECSKSNNLLVIFNCRKQNTEMQSCMAANMTDAHKEDVRRRREEEREVMRVEAAKLEGKK
mmetsp:Transcript_43065/g.67487  ORF Transcript_43065/g.67487 Transcript_43065/m.67487 type:complete len:111 (-) Transcript_43065:382-714(-)|eukprot:CAMPEP_0184314712 /NCGR_PEP_ID=MMETSP1049-20130417/76533_1 /TAXON_ID=77928 /ORGANISM="Proteomonas sulcata, Strain CCMP704" /LENGTH=110 /DNA_ID=CAMNT_0026632769 /DNA_START=23 /DNA_END=355 /DNA_ORIENTATION=-